MPDPLLRFDAAINPYGCAPTVVEAIARTASARDYRHYGDPYAMGLREALAAHLGLLPSHLAVYNGSGEAYVWQCVDRLMAGRGSFVAPHPSYERFVDVARRTAVSLHACPLEPRTWALDPERLIDTARGAKASLVMVSSPNNPTGNRLLDEPALVRILDALPETMVVVDEAYAEYGGLTFARLAPTRTNLIVLKTFSKAYGLAGLRVGYLVAHAHTVARALAYQIPWSVDTLALAAARAALADQGYLARPVEAINRDVARLGARLGALGGATVYPTDANFVLVELEADALARALRALGAARFAVRRRADMPAHLRITSMLPAHNEELLDCLGV